MNLFFSSLKDNSASSADSYIKPDVRKSASLVSMNLDLFIPPLINFVESFVNFVFPLQYKCLKFLHNKNGVYKILRYFINRSPNSVYGINLYLDSKISLENARNWSICDTYDAWSPKHDHPVSFRKWTNLILSLKNFKVEVNKSCGQGWCARLIKTTSNSSS